MNDKSEKDRYTRLKAITEFGIDVNWTELRKRSIGIIGVGGLGTVSAEMAVRCGIGEISLFDFDIVEAVNLNRSMFKPKDIGRSKVEVAKKILHQINPDVKVKTYDYDIMDFEFESIFDQKIQKFDIILNGLDNLPARNYLNIKSVEFKIPYIDAGASRSGLSGYVHPIIPYKTACASCIKRIDIKTPKDRGEPCVASLPSTMAILASFQIQEMLKYLLQFGKMIDYVMYNMLTGEFSSYRTKREPKCPICGKKAKFSKKLEVEKASNKESEEINELIKKLEEE